MEPEIARRCSDCGASVRGNAFFCPQCGRPLKAGAASTSSNAAETPEIPSRRINDPGQNAPTIDRLEGAPTPAPGLASTQESRAGGATDENQQRAEVVTPRASSSDDGGRSARQRVTSAARDVVEEKLSPRVEKLRHASNIMLEEAAYDPSLRFVLVAIAIIVLSLLLLLLNYLLG